MFIAGLNFMLRHEPVTTFDIGLLIEDSGENRRRCESALAALDAEWGPSEDQWMRVGEMPAGWLARQPIFCMTCPCGPIDIMRRVPGIDGWDAMAGARRLVRGDWYAARTRAVDEQTVQGTPYRGLSDADMLRCQLALGEGQRKTHRVVFLRRLIGPN